MSIIDYEEEESARTGAAAGAGVEGGDSRNTRGRTSQRLVISTMW